MEELIKLIRDNSPDADLTLVEKAYRFSEIAHAGQKRLSGENYFSHPLAVAKILASWKMDTTSVVVALLHDTIEEGAATIADIRQEFGENIAKFVESLSVVGQVKLRGSDEEELVEGLRKMFLATAKDPRVVVIKLADRIHNMQTVRFHLPDKQKKIAKETIEIFAPLAERLGMGQIKGELEDLSFPILYPTDFDWILKYSNASYKEAEKHIIEVKQKLLTLLAKESIRATINGRKKHLYSLYKKLLRPEINRQINYVNDLVALRILVDSIEQCYTALGVIHKVYKPVPNLGISDFIANPKPNGYRSIHTKVFGPDNRIIEIQIRTFAMHEEAEYGVASHIHYAALKNKGVNDQQLESGNVFAPQEKLSWVRQLANWQKEITDNQEFIHHLKTDVLSKRIFVFTPNGDVKDLPEGATPIDFAYAVHTVLGDRTIGTKINGKMASLDDKLKSGDICEIILAKEPKRPKTDWLQFVKTNLARREIHKGLKS